MTKPEISPGAVAWGCLLFYVNPWGMFFPWLLSVALHEAGHLLACRCTGSAVQALRVTAAGAELCAQFASYGAELCTAAAGPTVNLLLGLACLRQWPQMALLNGLLAAYNLLPVLPLDGGRILRCLLLCLCPLDTADRLTRVIGGAVLLGCVAAGVYATCVWHCGLWPCAAAGALLLKTGAAARRENSLAKAR